MTPFRVQVSYAFDQCWQQIQQVIEKAAERDCDDSGAGLGHRDLGWNCELEIEAWGIANRIENAISNVEVNVVRVEENNEC